MGDMRVPSQPNEGCDIEVDCCDGEHIHLRQGKVVHCVENKYYDTKNEGKEFNNFNEIRRPLKNYSELWLDVDKLTKDKQFVRTRCKYLNQENVECTEKQAHMLSSAKLEAIRVTNRIYKTLSARVFSLTTALSNTCLATFLQLTKRVFGI